MNAKHEKLYSTKILNLTDTLMHIITLILIFGIDRKGFKSGIDSPVVRVIKNFND